MEFFKNLMAKLLGKEIGGEIKASKAKLAAVIYVVILGVQELSKAWGHPIEIHPFVFQILGAAGLWAVRDAIKS